MYVLGPPTVLLPLLLTRVRAMLTLSRGVRARLDLCRRPQPSKLSRMGPLDNRLDPAGDLNGRLPSVVETNVVRCTPTIVVSVQRLTIRLYLRHLWTSDRVDIVNKENIIVLLIVLLMIEIDVIDVNLDLVLVLDLVLDLDLVRLSIDRRPPLVGNDRGLIDLLDRRPLHDLGFWIQQYWLQLRLSLLRLSI